MPHFAVPEMRSAIFLQDVATYRFTDPVKLLLNNHFHSGWIGGGSEYLFCLRRSPDLTVCAFIIVSLLK